MKDVREWVCACVILALGGCAAGPGTEMTSKKPYADLVGEKYRVVADDLYAYGVYESLNNRRVDYVTLVPGGRIGGPEFAFRRTVAKGQVVRILSAWQPFMLLKSSVYYLVILENSDLPEGVPVRLQLSRGNEGPGVDLNPAIYQRLPRDK